MTGTATETPTHPVPGTTRTSGTAGQLVPALESLLKTELPFRLRTWDGAEAGPPDAPMLVLRNRRALRHLLWRPDELGLARAYVSGHLDVEGDMYTALARMVAAQQIQMDFSERLRLLRELGGPKTLLPRVPPPPQEVGYVPTA